MNATEPDDEYGVPDEESPELTEEFFLWSVSAQDFEGDFMKSHAFLMKRTAFFETAKAIGFEKETFLPFHPNKPGFFERVTVAFEALIAAVKAEPVATFTKHAAE